MAGLDVAVDRSLEPAVFDRAMSRKAEPKSLAAPQTPRAKAGASSSKTAPAAAKAPKPKAARKAAVTPLEETIGYRFSDAELLEVAERSRLQSDADFMVANTLEGRFDWAFVGPIAGRYERVSRADLADCALDLIEKKQS